VSQQVIFINPPSPFLLTDRGAPALGILYLAAILRERGLAHVQVWDMTGDEALAQQFGCDAVTFVGRGDMALPAWIEEQPDDTLFALTSTSAQYHACVNLLTALKWTNPHWRVIIGGPHVSALPYEAVQDGFDTVFIGECDDGLPQWLDGILVAGAVEGAAPHDLDRLPFPARDLVHLPSYCANLGVGDGFATTIHASRGCPWSCQYCVRTLGNLARVYRPRSVANVIHELEHLETTYGLRRFTFTDDVFGLQKPWLIDFCAAVKDHRYQFRCNIRANYLYHDCLPLMAQAGFQTISFGMESADNDILRSISKNTVTLNSQALDACHAADIRTKVYFIWGFEGDGAASAEKMKRFIEAYRPASAQLATLIPLPGTPLYEKALTMGFQPDYSQLYHNGRERKGGDLRLPWWTDHTLRLRDDLLHWLEVFYGQPLPTVECPHTLQVT
jgi:anaerobic magnesium-protoporphyrin IX monomethyl ester cyclase